MLFVLSSIFTYLARNLLNNINSYNINNANGNYKFQCSLVLLYQRWDNQVSYNDASFELNFTEGIKSRKVN